MTRKLNAEERALWERVIASVTPLSPRRQPVPETPGIDKELVAAPPVTKASPKGRIPAPRMPPGKTAPAAAIGSTLDGGWDRRLTRGQVDPDFTVDLHGHTMDSAYRMLDMSLERAVRGGARVILLITGKPPRHSPGENAPRRGVIRAAVGDWLGASRFAGQIATVRNAHPRHGGGGALYIILKRDRLDPPR